MFKQFCLKVYGVFESMFESIESVHPKKFPLSYVALEILINSSEFVTVNRIDQLNQKIRTNDSLIQVPVLFIKKKKLAANIQFWLNYKFNSWIENTF